MDIRYLEILRDTPSVTFLGSSDEVRNQPMPISGILRLERDYNDGHKFPAALGELLFLSGARSYLMDYGLSNTRAEMQEDVREWMSEYDRELDKPFFAIDVLDTSQFFFVYLDEGHDDPIVFTAYLPGDADLPFPYNTKIRLSQLVKRRVLSARKGDYPS